MLVPGVLKFPIQEVINRTSSLFKLCADTQQNQMVTATGVLISRWYDERRLRQPKENNSGRDLCFAQACIRNPPGNWVRRNARLLG